MNFDFNDQIPEGMMDRVEQRLESHLVVKKNKRTKKVLVLLSILVLLIPATVYGFVNNSFDSWFSAIKEANKKGKTVELNAAFENDSSKIIFEDAVWEEDKLRVSYRIVDGVMCPRHFTLRNEKDEIINNRSGGELLDKEGALEAYFDKDKISGEKVFLSVEILEKIRYMDNYIDYKYSLNIDKEFLATGQAKVGKSFETEYGTITIEEIKIEDGKTILIYKYEVNDEIAELSEQETCPMIYPNFYIKDADNNTLESNSYCNEDNPGIIKSGLTGGIKNLDKPLQLAIVCDERVVDWKVPIEVKKFASEVVEINKDIELESGTVRIIQMTLNPASTYIKYEFIPAKDFENTIGIRPLAEMVIGNKKYICTNYLEDLSGEMEFPVGIDKKDLKKAKLDFHGIYRFEQRDERLKFTEGAVPTDFVVEGVKFRIEKMEIKEGKTNIEILVDGANRKFTDFDISYVAEEGGGLSIGVRGELEFTDSNIEQKLRNDPLSFEQSDIEKTIIRKKIELGGERDTVELMLEKFEFIDIHPTEIKIK